MPLSVACSVLLSGGSVIDLDGTVFVQLVIFFIAFLILRNFVFKPVLAVFDARDQAIDGTRENAREIEDQAGEKRDRFEAELRRARETANQERERLRAEGQKLARQIADQARGDSEKLVSEAKKKLDLEAGKINREVKAIVPRLARQIAGKLLQREVN